MNMREYPTLHMDTGWNENKNIVFIDFLQFVYHEHMGNVKGFSNYDILIKNYLFLFSVKIFF
jgi:hypothetical protein